MSDEGSAGNSKTRRVLVENAARLSLKNRILERLLNLFRGKGESDRLREEVLETAVEAIPCQAASLYLRTRKGDLVIVAARGPAADQFRGLRLPRGRGLAGACLADRRPIAVSDAQQDSRHAAEVAKAAGFEVRSLLAVPIPREGDAIGVIELINKSLTDEFQRHEIELVERVARTAGDLLKPLR